MKLANRLKKRKRNRDNLLAREDPPAVTNASPNHFVSPIKRTSIETSESSEISLIKVRKHNNLIRNREKSGRSRDFSSFDYTPDNKLNGQLEDLVQTHQTTYQYYFVESEEELNSLISQNSKKSPKFALPEYRELLNRGFAYDNSNMLTTENLEKFDMAHKILFLV
jgi:hypothetical protein